MRIAVSGTHCSGKSTLIEAFLAAHPEYRHEPEPYEWLTRMNDCLLDLVEELRNDGRPAIVELTGPLQARLSALERAL